MNRKPHVGSTPAAEDRPFEGVEASGGWGSSLRNGVQGSRWEFHRFPSRSHTLRAQHSGWGCQIIPFAWERRSFLRGIDHGAAASIFINSGNPVWVRQRGATKRTMHLSSLIHLMTQWSSAKGEKHRGGGWANRGPAHPCPLKRIFRISLPS